MYSGITLSKRSGNLMGTHQKIDRAARNHIAELLPHNDLFPSIKEILRFEGIDGPDGIKRKSPSKDEPKHFVDPFKIDDSDFFELVQDHYKSLVSALKDKDMERSAFEAAWLAHAIVDGMTPAHHFPYHEALEEIGIDDSLRDSVRKRFLLPGSTFSERLHNNYKYWGPRGLMISHGMFEMGVAILTLPMSLKSKIPLFTNKAAKSGLLFIDWFKEQIRNVGSLGLYDEYQKNGWTTHLAREVRSELMPSIVHAVAFAWYSAAAEAGLDKKK